MNGEAGLGESSESKGPPIKGGAQHRKKKNDERDSEKTVKARRPKDRAVDPFPLYELHANKVPARTTFCSPSYT